jgi:hypothetical protein
MSLAANWVDFAVALVWPLFVILFILLLLTGPGRRFFGPLLGRLTSFKAGGFEFSLTTEGATAARVEIEDTFQTYRTTIRREYDRQVRIYSVAERHGRVMEDLPALVRDTDVRGTIHVPDLLFADTMYQLLDYYPTGGGGGRAFPIRRGILGLAWRTRADQVRGEVKPNEPEELVTKWGMTFKEAKNAGRGRQSFLCVVLKDPFDTPIAVFYLDASPANAFSKPDEPSLPAQIQHACEQFGLTEALSKLGEKMRDRGPAVRIFDDV